MSQAVVQTDPLEGIVTRPDSFDPAKDYALVVARGDHPLGDYDVIDAQKILRYDLATFGNQIVNEGAIIAEAGGTIGTPEPAVIIGGDLLGAAGTYLGTSSQVYTVKLLTSGAGGEAMYTWSSTGLDNPQYVNQPFAVKAVATSISAGLADLAQYGCPVGVNGMQVVFVNPGGRVHGASSWVVQATYGAQPPVVSGNTITVSDVLIFMAGKVHRVKGETLTYPAATTGVAVIYAEWTRSLVSNTDDPMLTDPLSDEPQAYRERWVMVLSTTDTSGTSLPPNILERKVIPIYRWDRATDEVTSVNPIPFRIALDKTEGALPAARLVNVDQAETFRGLLAPRTFEPHGHFVCLPRGANARAYPSTNPASAGKLRITIPPAIAYIEGVRYQSEDSQDIELDQASDTKLVSDEPIAFSGALTYPLGKSGLGFPIAAITKCTAYVGLVGQNMTRSGTTDDTLPLSPVVSVEKVNVGAAIFSSPKNWSLQTGGIIRWVPGTFADAPNTSTPIPTSGQSYTVDYTYNKTMVTPADYKLTGGSIDFSAPGGDLPKVGSSFQVDYTYFLWRTDGVMIRPTGEIAVIRGIPQDTIQYPILPMYALPYCLVTVSPGTGTVRITGYTNDALTMEELCYIRDESVRQKINAARLDLAAQARSQTTANLFDIQTEAFSTTSIADPAYNAAGIAYDATIDTVEQELTLPYTQAIFPLVPAVPGTTVRTGDAFFSIPYVDELAVDAPRWSTDYPVNPYADFRPEPPLLRLTPDRDYWIDSLTLTSTESRIVQNGRHEDWRIVGTFTTNQTQVRNIPFIYMRQIAIQLTANHLVPGEKLRVRIDGKDVGITAQSGTAQIDGFTVQATPNTATEKGGDANMQATIPPLVPTGVTAVELFGDNGVPGAVWPAGYMLRAAQNFESNGTLRLVTTQSVVTLVQNDPVAQSVIFPVPRMITKVVAPIAATPPHTATSPPLVCEIRATDRSGEASSPTAAVLARVSKSPQDWATDPSAVFLDPVYQPANIYRGIVLRSSSNLYRVYVSQLGGPDRVSGGFITQQQIDAGIFMDSSNNRDWTLRQDWDLRCQVYVAKLTATEAYIYYQALNTPGATAIFLTVDQVVPDACSITWQYTRDNGANWSSFDPFTLTELPAVSPIIQIRARLWTRDGYVTPVVHRTNAQLLVLANKLSGRYVSHKTDLSGTKSSVSGQVDMQLPSGAQATVFISTNNGTTWVQVQTPVQQGVSDDGFTILKFNCPGLTSATPFGALRMRVDLATTNAAARPRVKRLYCYAL